MYSAHTRTHTQACMAEAEPQTTIRGTESDQRWSESCNEHSPPQTGRRKPRHGSEAWGAYQISVQSGLMQWPPALLSLPSLGSLPQLNSVWTRLKMTVLSLWLSKQIRTSKYNTCGLKKTLELYEIITIPALSHTQTHTHTRQQHSQENFEATFFFFNSSLKSRFSVYLASDLYLFLTDSSEGRWCELKHWSCQHQ